jgi:hypothetical protein
MQPPAFEKLQPYVKRPSPKLYLIQEALHVSVSEGVSTRET